MTVVVRRANERGVMSLDWGESLFTFSFGDYYDPRHLGFGALRALNENRLAPGAGFDAARRSDLEILSYVCSGVLRHRDSLGNDTHIGPGGVQRLSASSGVEYSEGNASEAEPLRFLQIWILPDSTDAAPSYEAASFAPEQKAGALRLIGSPDGRQGSVRIARDVDLYAASLSQGARLAHPLGQDREAWLQVLGGSVTVNHETLAEGDGIGLTGVEILRLAVAEDAEILLFDMSRD